MDQKHLDIPVKIELTPDQLDDVVDKAVHRTLIRIGFDTSDPIALQRDARWTRSSRELSEKVGLKVLMTAVGIVVAGTFAVLVLGLISWVARHSGGH